jgi:hypothetical protein
MDFVEMEVLDKLLFTFKKYNIKSGEVLEKSKLMETINSLPPSEKTLVRDAWHTLVSEGIIFEGNSKGPVLTKLGESILYND